MSDICAKELFTAAREKEQETGISIEDILVSIIYDSDDDQARVDAIRTYYAVMYHSSLDYKSLMDAPNLAEVLSMRE